MSDSQDPSEKLPPEFREAARRLQQFARVYDAIFEPILRAHSQSQAATFEAFGSIAAITRSIEESHFRALRTVFDSVSSMQRLQSSLIADLFDKTVMVEVMRQREELLSLFSSIASGPLANMSSILDEARITLRDLDLTAIPTIDELTEEELSDPEVQDVLEKSKKGLSLEELVKWNEATKNPYVQGILIILISDVIRDIIKRAILLICFLLFSSPDSFPQQ